MQPLARTGIRLITLAAGAIALGAAGGGQPDWLSLCSQCLSPTVISTSGIGTSHATVEARITRQGAAEWCENWRPDGKTNQCVAEQMASDDTKKVYRASADCHAGRITAIDGKAYSLAGRWTSDIGKGRTRWRDPAGRIVGQDNASNGLAISQQWEVLCPTTAASRPGMAAPAQPQFAAPAPGQFAPGQVIEARYGRDWVRGRVAQVLRSPGAHGPRIEYDVRLVNGKRGIVPASMLRPVSGQ